MKIVRIIGGLGNQMFQYALFLALKHKFPNETILIDASLMKSYKVHNGLEINRVFGVELPQASFSQLLKLTIPTYNYKLSRLIEKIFPNRKTELLDVSSLDLPERIFSQGDKYYNGYWLDYRYTHDIIKIIKKAYQFKLPLNEATKDLLNILNQENGTISIHVRRGDYLKASNYVGLCGIEYYSNAINYILKKVLNPKFYVFSDDIEWCRISLSEIISDNPITYVDWNKGSESPLDMLLMSKCNHNIIANSSFSWWGAMLNGNNNKIVCAPKEWTNNKSFCKFQMPDWILF